MVVLGPDERLLEQHLEAAGRRPGHHLVPHAHEGGDRAVGVGEARGDGVLDPGMREVRRGAAVTSARDRRGSTAARRRRGPSARSARRLRPCRRRSARSIRTSPGWGSTGRRGGSPPSGDRTARSRRSRRRPRTRARAGAPVPPGSARGASGWRPARTRRGSARAASRRTPASRAPTAASTAGRCAAVQVQIHATSAPSQAASTESTAVAPCGSAIASDRARSGSKVVATRASISPTSGSCLSANEWTVPMWPQPINAMRISRAGAGSDRDRRRGSGPTACRAARPASPRRRAASPDRPRRRRTARARPRRRPRARDGRAPAAASNGSEPWTAAPSTSCWAETPSRRIPGRQSIPSSSARASVWMSRARSVGSVRVCERVIVRKSPNRTLSCTVRAALPGRPEPHRDPLAHADQLAGELVAVDEVLRERLLVADRLHLPLGLDRTVVVVARERVEVTAVGVAERGDERGLRDRGELADRVDAEPVEPSAGGGPTPQRRWTGSGCRNAELAAGLDHEQAVGLGEVARELREQLRRGHAHRRDETGLRAHLGPDGRAHLRSRTVGPRPRPRRRGTPRRARWAPRAACTSAGSPSPGRSPRRRRRSGARRTRRAGTRGAPAPSASRSGRRTRGPRSSPPRPRRGCRARRRPPVVPAGWGPRAARPRRRTRRGRGAGSTPRCVPPRLLDRHLEDLEVVEARAAHRVAVAHAGRSGPNGRSASR